MRRWNAVIIAAAGAAVIALAVATGVAGSHAAGPVGSHAAGPAGSPAAGTAEPTFPQYTLTGVSCASTTACTAVGGAYYAREVAPAVLRWNGKSWRMQHAPNPPEHGGSKLTGVSCSRPDDCIAVGVRGGYQGTLAEHWNGKTWRVQPTPLSHTESSELNAVSCSSPAACTAVGDRIATTPPHKLVTVAMRWNGKTWAVQSTPNSPTAESELFSVSCPAATACTAIGSQAATPAPGGSAILAAQWDGRRWKLQPVPAPAGGPGRMHAVACASASYCVAVGVNYAAAQPPLNPEPGGGLQQPASVVWNGSTWKLAPVPYPRGANYEAYLYGVDCSAATVCIAVGLYTPGTEGGPVMAERWNGTSWTRQDTADPPGDTAQLTSVSCPASQVCIAVGDTMTYRLLAERWEGSAWALTPTP